MAGNPRTYDAVIANDDVTALRAQLAVSGAPVTYDALTAYSEKAADTAFIAQLDVAGNPRTYDAVKAWLAVKYAV